MSVEAVTHMVSRPSAETTFKLLKGPEVSITAVEDDIFDYDSSSESEGSSTRSSIKSKSGALEKLVKDVVQEISTNTDLTGIISPANVQPEHARSKELIKSDEDFEVAYDGKTPPMCRTVADICDDVLGVLARYRLVHQSDTSKVWGAKAKFLTQVERCVVRAEPVLMSLPAFPFKSPNKKTKVLGTLPDKGEEVALSHLEGLCLAIKDVYEPGANVFIVSDGLMYNGKESRYSPRECHD